MLHAWQPHSPRVLPQTMTARVVVMMTPQEKRALEDRSRLLGMTPSEFVRRVSRSGDAEIDEGLLDAIVSQMEANTAAMRRAINDTCDRVDATFAAMDAKKAARDAELAGLARRVRRRVSILDRVFDALKHQVEMRGDIDRLTETVNTLRERASQHDDRLFDHEKRLIRIEALIDLTRGGERPRLPRD